VVIDSLKLEISITKMRVELALNAESIGDVEDVKKFYF
jgi:hypothetical protein